jgi:indolepyruvate ferredoxin oxidoreductase beta subunit
MNLNCLITGVGGQGTVLLSRLIGEAAIKRGLEVRGTETIGMAQRGGGVVSHIRMGRSIHSPLISPGQADIILALEPAEAARALSFLADGGAMIVLDRVIPPVGGFLTGKPYDPAAILGALKDRVENLTILESEPLIKACGGPKTLNVAILGAALGKNLFPFTAGEILAVMEEKIPPRFLEGNKKALGISLHKPAL